jgi:hypothetical protein
VRHTKRGGWPYSQPPNVPFEINRASPQAKGLVGWWPGNAFPGGKVLRDLSGHRNDCAFPGGTSDPVWVTSERGLVLDFDGTDDYVETTMVLPADFSVGAWFKRKVIAPDSVIVYRGIDLLDGETFMISMNVGGNIRAGVRSAAPAWFLTAFYGPYNDDEFHHVMATYDDSKKEIKLYIDGILKETKNFVGAVNDDNSTFRIGRRNPTSSPFTGLIDDTRFYNRPCSATETWQMFDHSTRWELCRPLIRRFSGWKPPGPPPVGGHMTLWGRCWGP